MSSISQLSTHDPADLLCAAYDAIPRTAFRTSVERWDDDPALDALSERVEAAALSGATKEAARLVADGDDATRYAVVRGLYRALARVNPLVAGVPPPALAPLALRHGATGASTRGSRAAHCCRASRTAGDAASSRRASRMPWALWSACHPRILGGLRACRAGPVGAPDGARTASAAFASRRRR